MRTPATTSRRRFLEYFAVLGTSASTLLRPLRALGAEPTELGAVPEMTYQTLGRTGHRASRLVFGCGAALSRQPNDALLEAALGAGVNVFDVGFREYYRDAEVHLAPFAQKHRDDIFLISKAFVPLEVEPNEEITVAQAREGATAWQRFMDQSLRELGTDHLDAYYLMASYNPHVVTSDEIWETFQRAKQAGKVKHLGLSTHRNAQAVLEAAAKSERFDLAMIAITPAGWYDWESKGLLEESPPMRDLEPVLARARKAGIGLVGMKAGRYLAGRKFLGWGNPTAFDEHYEPKLVGAKLSAFQKSYAYVLEHGLDVVNADMQSFAHLEENLVAAATSSHYTA
ncbi:MAG: aldo/keto reductase [Myxococcota bacterium]